MNPQEPLLDDVFLLDAVEAPVAALSSVYLSWELRLWADVIDLLLLSLLTFTLALLLPWNDRTLIGGCCTLVFPLYKIICDGIWGATLGKRFLGFQVVQNKDGFPPIGWGQTLLRVAPFFPFSYNFIIFLWLQSLENNHQNAWVLTIYETYRFNDSIEWIWVCFFAITILPMFMTKKCRTLYDLWSGTVCIQHNS